MKKSIKILSIITILLLGFMVLSNVIYANDLTPIPVEDTDIKAEDTPSIIPNDDSTITPEDTPTIEDDKVIEDKVLPDAGFDSNMIYIIVVLIIFAVFAYIKVVKYNIE